jgi:hypothetical protein
MLITDRERARDRKRYREWRDSMTPKQFYELNRRYVLKYRYALTPEKFSAIVRKQRGRCKMCQKKTKRFVVDHDHRCCKGRRSCGSCIRGFLCSLCNKMLGHVEKIGLHKFVSYLGGSRA